MNDLLEKETRMWIQRSQSLWVVHGDKNSNYFHSRATQRHRRNKIEGIRNPRGQWCSNSSKIAKVLLEFYSDLFSSANTCQPKLAMEVIPTIVIDDMNKLLLA